MLSCVARCADPRSLLTVLALLLARDACSQADPRDALIDELRRRVDVLEKRLDGKPPPPPPPAAPKPAPKPAASEEAARVDEDARALERTLVRTGGLVLPKGTYELEPRLQYTYRSFQGLQILTIGGAPQVAQQDVSRNQFEASLSLRAGLPWRMQGEIHVPYVWARENRATPGSSVESDQVSGLGDIDLTLSKQFLDEHRGRPALLGALTWKSMTGGQELASLSPTTGRGTLSQGSGFPLVQASVTAVKRQDPLVFFGTISYGYIFERLRSGVEVKPGDSAGLRLGSILAASPDTSLRAAFDLTRSGRAQVGGSAVAGSDATVAMLDLGLAALLTAKTLLDLELGIGLTPDAPDFRLRVSLPIRF